MAELPDQSVASNPPAAGDPARRPRRMPALVAWLVRGYLLAVVLVWAWLFIEADRGPWATLFLFGPSWACALPWPLLASAAAIWNRRALVPLALTALAIVGPVMGFQVHLPRFGAAQPLLRVLTCNVEEHAVSVESLARLVVDQRPDVVALQEVRAGAGYRWPEGWYVVERNEFILASRWPIAEREHVLRFRGDYAAVRFVLDVAGRQINVFNVHLSTPRPGLQAMLDHRTLVDLQGAERLGENICRRAIESEHASRWVAGFDGPTVVVGDFNMPAQSAIFRRDWSRFSDAFAAAGWGFGFTKTIKSAPVSYGARIDHVLVGPAWRVLRSWVGPDVGSDHLPLWADLALIEP